MTSIFDPPLPDSCFETDAEFLCRECGHRFVVGELFVGEAEEMGWIGDCECGADRSEVERI